MLLLLYARPMQADRFMRFDKQAAMKAVAEAKLAPSNNAVAEHWFSLWDGDALPTRSQFRPAKVKALLPDLVLFDVIPEKSVIVRLAGTNVAKALGFELTGRDWLAAAEPDQRAGRLAYFTAVVKGAVGYAHRDVTMSYGGNTRSEEMLLPFAADSGTDAHAVLCHIDWPREFSFAHPRAPNELIHRLPVLTTIPLVPV
jgi:hypothetical protein